MNIKKYELIRESVAEYNIQESMSTPDEVFEFCRDYLKLGKRQDEHFVAFSFDSTLNLIAVNEISNGGYCESLVDRRKVFSNLLLNGAVAVMFAHNHPSGDLSPSGADLKCTDILIECGKMLDIEVLDHLIVSNYDYYSFAKEGLI